MFCPTLIHCTLHHGHAVHGLGTRPTSPDAARLSDALQAALGAAAAVRAGQEAVRAEAAAAERAAEAALAAGLVAQVRASKACRYRRGPCRAACSVIESVQGGRCRRDARGRPCRSAGEVLRSVKGILRKCWSAAVRYRGGARSGLGLLSLGLSWVFRLHSKAFWAEAEAEHGGRRNRRGLPAT